MSAKAKKYRLTRISPAVAEVVVEGRIVGCVTMHAEFGPHPMVAYVWRPTVHGTHPGSVFHFRASAAQFVANESQAGEGEWVDGGWWEEYGCGCVSDSVYRKRDLAGYCGTHGDDSRASFPEKVGP